MSCEFDLKISEEKSFEEGEDGNKMQGNTILPSILIHREELAEEYGGEVELPEVRFEGDTGRPGQLMEPIGKDVARAWKSASEWLQELVVHRDEHVKDGLYKNRLKAEEEHFLGEGSEETYRWQEDEETLTSLRPAYRSITEGLIEGIGKPSRSDFDSLYPHEFDDPGLSERARRAVRDLKAVFGREVLDGP
ncbi:hypothetical protein KGY64_03215 [Candidatus Bipolaricaulota bacterium]|nr:hypothetical protein [Candidatus Bipolaricaulota bacterium]